MTSDIETRLREEANATEELRPDDSEIAVMREAADELVALKTHTKKLSEAIRKVRPLGGSELFAKVGDEYFADPDFCGAAIDELRNELHEARCEQVKLRKKLARAKEALRAHAILMINGIGSEPLYVMHCRECKKSWNIGATEIHEDGCSVAVLAELESP